MVKKDVTSEEVNAVLKTAAEGKLKGILEFCEEPLVSVDFNGDTHSSTVDALSTRVLENRFAKVLAWYYNETGYAQRCVDLMGFLAKTL